MDGNFITLTILITLISTHSTICLLPGSNATTTEPNPINHNNKTNKTDPKQNHRRQFTDTNKISTTDQKDITTPITTVPTIIPNMPIINPNSNPDDSPVSPAMTTPSFNPATIATGSSWCIASLSASQTALQIALDYACGMGGADCGAIQIGGNCYTPNSVRDHASYAFNSYYQKNPLPNSCNFGGTAVLTSTNPSTGSCEYQSTSTSSSILNTTNSSGSTVFGAVPTGPTTSSSPAVTSYFHSFIILFVASSIL